MARSVHKRTTLRSRGWRDVTMRPREYTTMRAQLPLLNLMCVLLVGCNTRPDGVGSDTDTDVGASRGALRVHVVDADGYPVHAAWVTVAPYSRDAATNADGDATLERLAPGAVHVEATAPGFLTASADVSLELAGADVRVTLSPIVLHGATLSGSVSDPYAAPVVGATVLLDGSPAGTTAADGTFTLTGLAAGHYAVNIAPPDGTNLLPQDMGSIDLITEGKLRLDTTLPGHPGATSTYIGSTSCLICHPDEGAAWQQSAHARAARSTADLSGTDIADAVEGGVTVSLNGTGATAELDTDEGGAWTVNVRDGLGHSTGPLTVTVVYGARRHGAALALDVAGTLTIAPVVWAGPGEGLGAAQPDAGFIPAWVDSWLPGGTLAVSTSAAPPAALSFDLSCAGCHASGFKLQSAGGSYALATLNSIGPGPGVGPDAGDEIERVVGCEACHGPGSRHRRFAPTSKDQIFNPAYLSASQRLDVCAGCHEAATAIDHPFADPAGTPLTAEGTPKAPWTLLSLIANATPNWWESIDASRVRADQVGELRASPHRASDSHFAGACEDCHQPHGSAFKASLRHDPWDNALCTSCHALTFPDAAAIAAHSGHTAPSSGAWGSASCVGCHMPRSAVVVRGDANTGVGEARSHGMLAWTPNQVLATFGAAGASTLPKGEVPVDGCIDCHVQREEAAKQTGGSCNCPQGDVTKRTTWEALKASFDAMFPGAE